MQAVIGALKDANQAHNLMMEQFYTSIAKRIVAQLAGRGLLADNPK